MPYTGPQLDNAISINSGSSSITVANNPRRILLIIGETGVTGGPSPVYPTATFNGVSPTWITPQYYSFLNAYSPAIGYIVNPPVGTYTITTNISKTCFASIYDVDTNSPFDTVNAGSSQAATPQTENTTTNTDYSLCIKAVSGSGSLGQNYSDGAGETNLYATTNGGLPFIPRASFKPTTGAGAQSLSTSWTGGGSVPLVYQIVELRWGGLLAASASVSTANSASRLASVSRSVSYLRGIAATVSNAANRLSTPNSTFLKIVSVITGNAAGRLATVASVFRIGMRNVTKHSAAASNQTKNAAVVSNVSKNSASIINIPKS